MPAERVLRAIFSDTQPVSGPEEIGVTLGFRPIRTRLDIDRIEDFADLGPEMCVPSVAGLGKVLRILRAARLAVPAKQEAFLGEPLRVAEKLERAFGVSLSLKLRDRSRIRFTAWTEDGVETINDVAEVLEAPDAYFVTRRSGRFPVRVPRSTVVRQLTECERWFEVVDIQRAS
jgi:hypothetical protein